jgi:hypothetical protein
MYTLYQKIFIIWGSEQKILYHVQPNMQYCLKQERKIVITKNIFSETIFLKKKCGMLGLANLTQLSKKETL